MITITLKNNQLGRRETKVNKTKVNTIKTYKVRLVIHNGKVCVCVQVKPFKGVQTAKNRGKTDHQK